MPSRTGARRSAVAAPLLLGLAAMLALHAASSCFVPAAQPVQRFDASAAAAATLVGAAPAFAAEAAKEAATEVTKEAAKEPLGFLNFGKIPLGGGFELNLDIPETGIVNIAVLIAGLVYLLGPLLSESMATREKEIQGDIDDAIAKFNEANSRFAEAEKAQAQAGEVIAEINASIDKDKKEFEASLMASMKNTLERQEAAAAASIKEMENGAASRIESYIQTQVISRGLNELRVISDDKKDKYMDMAIEEL